jgi:hypothetical protein
MSYGVNVNGSPSWVFQPVTALNQTVKITNNGSAPLYAGPLNTLLTPGAFPAAIPPNWHLYINPATAAVYVSCGYVAGSNTTTLAGASANSYPAGTTQFTVASQTHLPVGQMFLLGNASSSQEVLVVATSVSTTVLTTTLASLYDHVAAATVTTCTPIVGQAYVSTGAL